MTDRTPETSDTLTVAGRGWWARIWAEPGILVSALVGAVAILSFLKLADEIRESGTLRFDDRILLLFRRAGAPDQPLGPAWMPGAVRDLSAMGGPVVLAIVVGAVAGYMLILGYRRGALRLLGAAAGGVGVVIALKHLYDRPRPTVVLHLMDATSTSFPSGHSMLSAVIYLSLGAMVARVTPGLWGKAFVLSVAMIVTALVGFSRVYMGVHYPSDVLAGWIAGLAWALACSLGARWRLKSRAG